MTEKQQSVEVYVDLETFYVEYDPDLWKVRDWLADTSANVRIIQTVVGPYGAIDQKSGTTYFDIGDVLVKADPFGLVFTISAAELRRIIEENGDDED